MTSDITWLTQHPLNPLGIGQYVNNQSKSKGIPSVFTSPRIGKAHLRQNTVLSL